VDRTLADINARYPAQDLLDPTLLDSVNTVMEVETTKAGNNAIYYNVVVPTLLPELVQPVLTSSEDTLERYNRLHLEIYSRDEMEEA
jgi:hypothetical protein